MRFLIAILLLVATVCRGAVPSYTVFRGSGGIAVTTNPPNGLIVIDGSGVFTSSGTNSTLSTSTNGVLVAVASTNINVVIGNNMDINATNSASKSHFGVGIKSNLSFFATGAEMVIGTWGAVAGISNVATGDLMLYNPDLAATDDLIFTAAPTAPSAIFTAVPGPASAQFLGIVAGSGLLYRTNSPTNFTTISVDVLNITTNQITAQFVTQMIILTEVAITNVVNGFTNAAAGIVGLLSSTNDRDVRVKGLVAGANVTLTDNGTNIAIASALNTPETNSVLTNIIGTVARNVTNVVSLSTTNATSKPLTNSYTAGVLTLFGIEGGANVTITPNGSNLVIAAAASSPSAETNAVLTNLVGTVARNVTNVVSLSTTNETSKPLTNSYTAGVLTIFGIEAGANVTVTPNGSNLVIAATGGSFSVSGNSNQIPYLNPAGTGFIFGGTNRTAPGFGFDKTLNNGNGALMIHQDATNTYSLVDIGPPTRGSDLQTFVPSLNITNRYAYSGSGDKITQEVVRVTMVDVTDGSSPESFIQTWKHGDDNGTPTLAAGIRRDGQFQVAHGVMYKSNSLASTLPTAAQLGVGGHWIGISNGAVSTLVDIYSLDGSSTAMKVLAP